MATVLKSQRSTETQAAQCASGLAGFNLDDLASEGRHRLEQCRLQIQEMLDDAKSQCEQLRQQAEAQGYQEGMKRAQVDNDERIQQAASERAQRELQMMRGAVVDLHQTQQQWLDQYAQSLHTIALAAAKRIVRRKLESESDLLVQWAADAVASTRSAAKLTIAVHPETLAELGQALDEMLAAPDLPELSEVQADESLSPDEVVVRQTGGEIRAGLETQLQRLEELLS